MKNLSEKLPVNFGKQDHQIAKTPETPTKNSNSLSLTKRFKVSVVIFLVLLLCLCVYWTVDTFTVASKAAKEAFDIAKEETDNKIFQQFYDRSYKAAESAHHVSNSISISIGDLNSVQKLEVLRVSEVDYQIPEPDDKGWFDSFLSNMTEGLNGEMISWLEVPGKGIFTVNLKVGEFIIDDEHQYVLIRIPNPTLTAFTIDYQNVELLLFDKGGAFKNSAKCGEDKAREQLANAELSIRGKIANNQEFYEQARVYTESMLENLVRQLNPQLPDLVVNVEFIT